MSFFLGSPNIVKEDNINKKENERKSNDTTLSLNYSSVSKHLSFNEGNNEGYYQVRPKAIRASHHNPRPDWMIDDDWLTKHVNINMQDIYEQEIETNCLVKIEEVDIEGTVKERVIFPGFDDLINSPDESQRKEYEFLVDLAKSIRETGQIQPIEIESDTNEGTFVVLEGHLRRLACILGRVGYIKAIRNEGLQSLSKRDKIGRQITENSLRSNISLYGNYILAKEEIGENSNISVRDLSCRLKISKDVASAFIKLNTKPESYHDIIYKTLKKNVLTTRALIKVISIKRQDLQESFILKFLKKNNISLEPKNTPKPRGTLGRTKSVATFKIKSVENCIRAGKVLMSRIPELAQISNIKEVKSVEDMEDVLKSLEIFLLEGKH